MTGHELMGYIFLEGETRCFCGIRLEVMPVIGDKISFDIISGEIETYLIIDRTIVSMKNDNQNHVDLIVKKV